MDSSIEKPLQGASSAVPEQTLIERLKLFMTPWDGRFEDLKKGKLGLNIFRDFAAGLIVAMVAIPLAMGFAIASGLRPEQGIVGGAVAGMVGALFGGSKYQVYGPTAAFIPVIASCMRHYDHRFLVLASIIAGVVLCVMGILRIGRVVALVPHSIVVGFTIGIAVTIAISQVGEVLGIKASLGYSFFDKLRGVAAHIGEFNIWALVIALGTFAISKVLLQITVYLPAPLIAVAIGTGLSMTVLKSSNLALVKTKYGAIPTDLLHFTGPSSLVLSDTVLKDLAYYVTAIVFVSAIESLLCSRMADRLADNKGKPFNANKELWGQGLVQTIVPIFNGFPHTGALARTATNIKLGAISPLAGVFKCILKLLLAFYLATYLELVPMACIGGVLLYVAVNMVKPSEVKEALEHGRFHTFLMIYTAIAVIVTDFLTGVLTALVIYVGYRLTRLVVKTTQADEGHQVRIEGALTVLAIPKLERGLKAVPQGSTVRVDLDLDIMDSPGWKALEKWCSAHIRGGGSVRLDALHEAWNPDQPVDEAMSAQS